jgi:toxin ParE1/3/4
MTYRVELTNRAIRDLRRIYRAIDDANATLARLWFDGLEAAIASLDEHPARAPPTPEDGTLRHLLYGHRPVYRIIVDIDEAKHLVRVMAIRHGARRSFTPTDE